MRARGVRGIAQVQSGEFGRSSDRVGPEQRRAGARRLERRVGGGQLPGVGERLPRPEQQARLVRVTLVKEGGGSLQQARGAGHVTAVDRLQAGRAEVPGGTFAQRAAMRVDGSELGLVPERLLEVVSDDLLELHRPGPANLEEPVGVALVQAGPGPLKQAVVGGVSNQNVAELVVRAVRPQVDGLD